MYEKVQERIKDIKQVGLTTKDMLYTLYLEHHDRSRFLWDSCHYELLSFPDPNHPSKTVKTVIICPEHHPYTWYDLADLDRLQEVDLDWRPKRKVWEKTVKKNLL